MDSTTFNLALTPLSPLHIGTGQIFEPTNYLVRDKVLFHFQPELLPLVNAEKSRLINFSRQSGSKAVRDIQSFFASSSMEKRCVELSDFAVDVCSGVFQEYKQRLGKQASSENNEVVNQLEIHRSAYNPYVGEYVIPGTALKGAIRTAWLEALVEKSPESEQRRFVTVADQGRKLDESKVLKGKFSADPFRLLSVGDATSDGAKACITYAVNKKRSSDKQQSKRQFGRFESLAMAQCRAFNSSIKLHDGASLAMAQCRAFNSSIKLHDGASSRLKRIIEQPLPAIDTLFAGVNCYFVPRLKGELSMLEGTGYVQGEWAHSVRKLLDALTRDFKSGKVMLLRVGRFSGADSMTIDKLKSVNVTAPDKHTGSTTIWLSAVSNDAVSNMHPFGWVLVESEGNHSPCVDAFCKQFQSLNSRDFNDVKNDYLRQVSGPGLEDVRQQLCEERLEGEQNRQQAVEAEAQKQAFEQELATLTLNLRRVKVLGAELEDHTGEKIPVSGKLYNDVKTLVDEALVSNQRWHEEEKIALATMVEKLAFSKIEFSKKPKQKMKAILRELRGEAN